MKKGLRHNWRAVLDCTDNTTGCFRPLMKKGLKQGQVIADLSCTISEISPGGTSCRVNSAECVSNGKWVSSRSMVRMRLLAGLLKLTSFDPAC